MVRLFLGPQIKLILSQQGVAVITTLSIEAQLKQWLRQRGMSTDAFASLARLEGIPGCSETRFRQAFGGRCFDAPLSLRLWDLLNEIEALCQKVEPLVLDLSDATVVHKLLKQRRNEELLVIVMGPDQIAAENDGGEAAEPEAHQSGKASV